MTSVRLHKESTYATYRQVARDLIAPGLAELSASHIRLSDITQQALDQATQWSDIYTGKRKSHRPSWSWQKEVQYYRRRPRRIELAIWVDPTLCGLVLGRISSHRVVASIHLLEANPDVHPLRGNVAVIASRFLEAMAVLTGCRESAIERPVHDLVPFYKDLGFVKAETRKKCIVRLKKTL